MSKTYSEKNIERYAGLTGIRKKPTPYIGPTDSDGLWTCWREPADNTVDQALAGRNKLVHLIADKEPNVYWVIDAGEGIPVGQKEFEDERGRKEKLSTFYVVTGLTHAGANFKGDTISRGTHGIGIKATNAMSKRFTVWTFREGQWWCIEYRDAKLHKEPYKSKAPKLPFGFKAKKGTVVRFEPDLSLFQKGTAMRAVYAREWAELTSYLVKGLEVRVTTPSGKTKTFKTKGPSEYLEKKVEELKATVTGKPFYFSSREVDIAIAFTDVEGENVNAYTNGLFNKEGGEHIRAMTNALFKSLQPFMKKAKGSKKGQESWPFTPTDLKDGLLGLVNYKIAAPKFNNQPKDKLVDERVYDVAYPQLEKAFSDFWKSHKGMAKDVVARATELRNKTADFLKDKKLVKNVKAASKGLAAKLAGIVGNAPVEKRELFLVEGDSAGGGAKRARNKSFQAVYPLRGKPLNVMDAAKDKVNSNKEIIGLLAALGVQMDGKNAGTIRYGKVICMADPDVDGSHINTLLLGALHKYTPHLFKQGCVYVVKAPLFKAKHKGETYFGMTKEGIYKQTGTKNVDITYIKGWGEVNESDLKVALSPEKRKLYRVVPADKGGTRNFELLLGKKPEFRKKMMGIR